MFLLSMKRNHVRAKLKHGEPSVGTWLTLPDPMAARLMARVGFDWRRTEDVFHKLDEEIAELHEAISSGDESHVHEELGDLLFTIANIARKLNVNAEDALQSANRKFSRRFESMESKVRSGGQNLDDLTLEQMDGLWDEAKAAERA